MSKPKKRSHKRAKELARRKRQRERRLSTQQRVLQPEEMSVRREAKYIVGRAQQHDACVVAVDELVFFSTDTGDAFTMNVKEGEITKNEKGTIGTPDVIVEVDSETLCDMFWGDINPTQKYLRGEIKVKGSQEDVMRIDAITAIIWPEV